MSELIRLDRYVSECGVLSRKQAVPAIKAGRVTVDGEVVTVPGFKISEDAGVTLDGNELSYSRYSYYMLYKPAGCVSAVKDKLSDTVIGYLKDVKTTGLFPVGRLDKDTEGLSSWEGLDDATLLLSDDNFGNLRTVPDEKMRERKAGWGIYYHFDYHGDPISYEWVNSTPLIKAWEQLTTAYEYGIRKIWIANVGDLRPQELPLSSFMFFSPSFMISIPAQLQAIRTRMYFLRSVC